MTSHERHERHDSHRFTSLAELRRAVRGIARRHGLPVDLRARLVVSASAVAGVELAAGRPVVLESAVRRAAARPPLLTVACRWTDRDAVPDLAELPLPAEVLADGSVRWEMPVTWSGRPQQEGPEDEALEHELQHALARADALAADHRRLQHELSETNSGVLALYVQLEERDERLRRAHGQTLRELEDALRPPPVEVEGVEMAVHYAPAGTDAPTGGDLYDWFTLPDGSIHITVVDALGHGVASTRSALNVTHAVRTLVLEGHRLDRVVERTDEVLLPFDPALMATLLLVRIDPVSGAVTLANGSHPPALLLRGDGRHGYLELKGRGIGFPMAGSDEMLNTRLDPGDLLVLYTDGLTESRRNPLEGEARLVEAAARNARRPIDEIPGRLADEMHTVILHPDDTLALAIRRTAPPGAVPGGAGDYGERDGHP
ncbi:PP2C family protein-serine/threonine phosphatase [Streptomyces triticirhizae]|uniref:Serine/threonine-protein phosphatase n=1 Tax=Streptomyces triticirhizae TaxID=2483353 RepID=A0A3M2M1T5_9ACTN|nr:PP2C family protein-serine/threonine phosphatase [Streptomyces triticirhizae]RMI43581.1 serine/threonine-protein phosphatase [Streptomyces triticirhizae]